MKHQPFRTKQSGFTLIEMMIAMTILAMISIGVYETTARTFSLRDRLEAESDFYNTVRGGLDIMRRDIIMLYTPQMSALPASLTQQQVPNAGDNTFDPGRATPFWGPFLNKNNIRPSRFIGDENKITFISNSHIRLYRETQESEFAKIVYALEDDLQSDDKGKALIRYEDPAAFIDDGKESDTNARYVILSRVKSLKFEFLNGDKDQYFSRWDTDSPDTKNKFPALIRVSVEVIPPLPLPPNATLNVQQVYKPELSL